MSSIDPVFVLHHWRDRGSYRCCHVVRSARSRSQRSAEKSNKHRLIYEA